MCVCIWTKAIGWRVIDGLMVSAENKAITTAIVSVDGVRDCKRTITAPSLHLWIGQCVSCDSTVLQFVKAV